MTAAVSGGSAAVTAANAAENSAGGGVPAGEEAAAAAPAEPAVSAPSLFASPLPSEAFGGIGRRASESVNAKRERAMGGGERRAAAIAWHGIVRRVHGNE